MKCNRERKRFSNANKRSHVLHMTNLFVCRGRWWSTMIDAGRSFVQWDCSLLFIYSSHLPSMKIDILPYVFSVISVLDYSSVERPVHNDDLVVACIPARPIAHPVELRIEACGEICQKRCALFRRSDRISSEARRFRDRSLRCRNLCAGDSEDQRPLVCRLDRRRIS